MLAYDIVKIKQMKRVVVIFALVALVVSCQSKLADGYLNVEEVNFASFSAKKYYSDALKAEWSDYHKKRKSSEEAVYFFQAEVDTIDQSGSNFQREALYCLTYNQTGIGRSNWETGYNVGFFRNLQFDDINAVTDLDDTLLLLSGKIDSISKVDLAKFVTAITETHGSPTEVTNKSGMSSNNLKKWDFKDKKLVLVSDGKLDYQNVVLDEEQKKFIAEVESRNHTAATVIICRNEYYDVFKNMSSRSGFMTYFEK